MTLEVVVFVSIKVAILNPESAVTVTVSLDPEVTVAESTVIPPLDPCVTTML